MMKIGKDGSPALGWKIVNPIPQDDGDKLSELPRKSGEYPTG
jgi:hypothetical protein